jgi:hypothetical protein
MEVPRQVEKAAKKFCLDGMLEDEMVWPRCPKMAGSQSMAAFCRRCQSRHSTERCMFHALLQLKRLDAVIYPFRSARILPRNKI